MSATTPSSPAASAPAPAPTPAPTLSSPAARSRRLALGVIATGLLMTVLDGSIVTVAMPAIQNDLGFTPMRPQLGRERLPDRLRRSAAALRAAR